MKNLHPSGTAPAIYKAPVPPKAPMRLETVLSLLFGIPFFAFFAIICIGWISYEVQTPEQRAKVAAEVARADAESSENESNDNYAFMCADAVKDRLRDPGSYQMINRTGYHADELALVAYRANNGFGGMSQATAQCNFEAGALVSVDMDNSDSDPALPVRS
jgi:hypothetical protein